MEIEWLAKHTATATAPTGSENAGRRWGCQGAPVLPIPAAQQARPRPAPRSPSLFRRGVRIGAGSSCSDLLTVFATILFFGLVVWQLVGIWSLSTGVDAWGPVGSHTAQCGATGHTFDYFGGATLRQDFKDEVCQCLDAKHRRTAHEAAAAGEPSRPMVTTSSGHARTRTMFMLLAQESQVVRMPQDHWRCHCSRSAKRGGGLAFALNPGMGPPLRARTCRRSHEASCAN